MGRSGYPRRGHRLAPSALRQLLQVPVPAAFHSDKIPPGLQLCDLDESAWEWFDEATCKLLAAKILQTIGRAARVPLPIADQRLPPLPAGIRLTDLDLEVRTLNCLASAGILDRPQDLRTFTIEGVLSLRGFWVKCLLDLLTSLEYVVDHPEVHKALRNSPITPLTKRASGHYPRPGYRLAPETLKDILLEPIPDGLVSGTPAEHLRLCDLTEQVWTYLSPETIARLSELIVARVNVSGYNRAIQERHLPKPPKAIRLEDLPLENRTYNCLYRHGIGARFENLDEYTVGHLLNIKAFGAKCLVDLLCSLETLVSRGGKLDAKLTEEAALLGAIPEAAEIHFSDPRLGPLLRATDSEANTVAELVHHVLKRRLDPPDPLRLYHQICEIRSKILAVRELPLEEELMQIFSSPASDRDRQIVAQYYGWDGGGCHTLEELGQKHGLSRERIRQVCVRAVKRNRRVKVFAPVLDRVLEFIAQRLPITATRLNNLLEAARFSRCKLPLEAIQQAAVFLSRKPVFDLVPLDETLLVVAADMSQVPRTVVQVARRAVVSYGATTISEIAAEYAEACHCRIDPALIVETLQTLRDFRWLDQKLGWFQLECLPQYGLPNLIEKVLAVAGRIDVARLRSAIARYRRAGRRVPPNSAILEFCRSMPGVRVDGNLIIADPPTDWEKVLGGVEAGMVRVLKEHGPVLERGEFEEHCIRKGMNRFSFNAIIMCSPVIAQYERSVYGLLGAKIDRKTIQSLSMRKTAAAATKVLHSYGQLDGGRAYLAYQLSKAAISGGVITVPAAMKDVVGGKFTLRTDDGKEAGILVSKNGCAWGLGPVLRGRNAQAGEYLLILFNTLDREAVVFLGDQGVLSTLPLEERHIS